MKTVQIEVPFTMLTNYMLQYSWKYTSVSQQARMKEPRVKFLDTRTGANNLRNKYLENGYF